MAPKAEDGMLAGEIEQQPKELERSISTDDDYFEGGTKGSIRWKLGSYKTFQPFAIYISFMYIYKKVVMTADEPVNIPMSRKFLMKDSDLILISMGIVYILFSLVWGPNMMKNRKPIVLKKFMMAYNLFQVVFCSYIFYKGGMLGWFYGLGIIKHDPSVREREFNLFCEPEDRSDSLFNQKTADICYLYFLAKALDWFDTVFLVLGKKWSHISLLHVFHHMGMFFAAYGFNQYIGSGTFTGVGFINSFVHVILYAYYFLALCGPTVRKYLWWKKYITVIQMVQFIIIALFGCIVIVNGCELHRHAKINLIIYAMGFLALFYDFYTHEYKKKSSTKGKKENEKIDGKLVNGKIEKKYENGKTDEKDENGITKKEN